MSFFLFLFLSVSLSDCLVNANVQTTTPSHRRWLKKFSTNSNEQATMSLAKTVLFFHNVSSVKHSSSDEVNVHYLDEILTVASDCSEI